MLGHARTRAARWTPSALSAIVLLGLALAARQPTLLKKSQQVLARHISKLAEPACLTGGAGSNVEACKATPWLLPPHTPLPYSGLHENLDALLAVQGRVVGSSTGAPTKAVSLLLMNAAAAALTQNYVYSLVKFAGGWVLALQPRLLKPHADTFITFSPCCRC